MDTSDLVAEQDSQRTARAFISFLSTALNVDQSYAGQDGYAVNNPRQYQSIGPGGLIGVEGTASSNGQTIAFVTSPMVLLVLAVGAYFVWKG